MVNESFDRNALRCLSVTIAALEAKALDETTNLLTAVCPRPVGTAGNFVHPLSLAWLPARSTLPRASLSPIPQPAPHHQPYSRAPYPQRRAAQQTHVHSQRVSRCAHHRAPVDAAL